MLISWNMLNETLSIPATLEEVAERLTLTGCEVESVERPCAMVKDVQVAHIESLGRHPEKETCSSQVCGTASEPPLWSPRPRTFRRATGFPTGGPDPSWPTERFSAPGNSAASSVRECCSLPQNWAYPRLRTSSAFSAFPETLPWAATWSGCSAWMMPSLIFPSPRTGAIS